MSLRTKQFIWYFIFGLNLAIIGGIWWAGAQRLLAGDVYQIIKAAGQLAGLVGAYLVLVQFLLMSRLPPLERSFGFDKLTRMHRWNGELAITALLLHPVLLLLGYSRSLNLDRLLRQEQAFLFKFEDVLQASFALTLLVLVVGLSIYIVRRKLSYETWYYAHLFTYLAILFAFGHQLKNGGSFVGNPAAVTYWWTLYLAVGSLFVWFRMLVPLRTFSRQRFVVERVVEETPNVHSIYITGRNISSWRWMAGQFAIFTFLDTKRWWQAHPFSISLGPNPNHIRITVKSVGDFTAELPRVKPGTAVLVEGPFGKFTTSPIKAQKVLLIAGGIGITPLRAQLEGLATADTELVYSVRTESDLALRTELEQLAKDYQNLKLHYLLSEESMPGFDNGMITTDYLAKHIPDWQQREAFICGPPPMMTAIQKMLEAGGIVTSHIHTERFSLYRRG